MTDYVSSETLLEKQTNNHCSKKSNKIPNYRAITLSVYEVSCPYTTVTKGNARSKSGNKCNMKLSGSAKKDRREST